MGFGAITHEQDQELEQGGFDPHKTRARARAKEKVSYLHGYTLQEQTYKKYKSGQNSKWASSDYVIDGYSELWTSMWCLAWW